MENAYLIRAKLNGRKADYVVVAESLDDALALVHSAGDSHPHLLERLWEGSMLRVSKVLLKG